MNQTDQNLLPEDKKPTEMTPERKAGNHLVEARKNLEKSEESKLNDEALRLVETAILVNREDRWKKGDGAEYETS